MENIKNIEKLIISNNNNNKYGISQESISPISSSTLRGIPKDGTEQICSEKTGSKRVKGRESS